MTTNILTIPTLCAELFGATITMHGFEEDVDELRHEHKFQRFI
ncbi:hypothetical protein SFC07_11745 [Corynebacterium callunae]